MQPSVLTRLSGHTVHPDKVCLTVSCVYTHPVQGLASLRTLDYNKNAPITHALQACKRRRPRDELHDSVLTQDWLELLPHIFMLAPSCPAGACACLG